MQSKLLEIQYRRKEGLLLEQQKDNDNVVKKGLMDIGVILDGTFTFGTGITAFLPIVRDLINLEQPQITEQTIILVYITAMWIILNRHQDKVKKLLQIVREQGLSDTLTRIVDFLKSLENVVLKVADEVGYAASSIADVGAFTFLAFPILDGLVALINTGDITLGEPSGYLKSVLLSIGILSIKNIFNSIITKIKSKFGTLEESNRIMKYNDCGISNDVLNVIKKSLFTESQQLWVLPKDVNTTNKYVFNDNSHIIELKISRNVKLRENYFIDIKEGKSNNFKITLEINPLFEPNVYRDIKLTLKECFGKYGYPPITRTLSEQKSNIKIKNVFENDEYKIQVPLDMESFCSLSEGTNWCKLYSGSEGNKNQRFFSGTFYVLESKKNRKKTLIHDTGRIFLFREPDSNGNDYQVVGSDGLYGASSNIKKTLSDEPELADFFNLKYTGTDMLKYGMSLSNEKLLEYSKTNDFASAVYSVIKNEYGNPVLTGDEIEDRLSPYLGNDVRAESSRYSGGYDLTDGTMVVDFKMNHMEWTFGEETYEQDILNLGEEGDGWYYGMAMNGTHNQDHDYLEEEELEYLSGFLDEDSLEKVHKIFRVMDVRFPERTQITLEDLSEDGKLHSLLSKYFPKEWESTSNDILWDMSQGLGEHRSQSLKKYLLDTLIFDASIIHSGYVLEIDYTQLLTLINQYDLKTFSEIKESGFNELNESLYEIWYDEWGYSDETRGEIKITFDRFLEDIEVDEMEKRNETIDSFDKIIRDLGFDNPAGNPVYDKTFKWGDVKLHGRLKDFNPENGMVTLQINSQPFRSWGNQSTMEEYKIPIEKISDYVNSPDLWSVKLRQPTEN